MTPEGLVELAKRRASKGGLFRSYCKGCRCQMKVDAAHLLEEYRGDGPWCFACSGGNGGSYGGSPQSSTDNAYHGSRYHSAEWEG